MTPDMASNSTEQVSNFLNMEDGPRQDEGKKISEPQDAETEKESLSNRTESPVDKCAICLGTPENRSYTDSCFHEFCFVCLLEWSKVKAECPLCKLKFKNIIHNIRSMSDFDEFQVIPPETREIERVGRSRITVDVGSHLFGLDELGRRFRYNSTMTTERVELINHIRQLQSRLQELHRSYQDEYRVRRERERLERLHHMYVRSANRPGTLGSSLEFRRMIYERGLRVKVMQPGEQAVDGHDDSVLIETYRDTSPLFYRENPAQMHRLLRWLHRELNVFFNGRPARVNFVCEFICTLITAYDIRSEELKHRLSTVLHTYTDHFLHEFYHFARSPLEMDHYDRVARYERPTSNQSQPIFSINLPSPTLPASSNVDEPELLSVSSTPSSVSSILSPLPQSPQPTTAAMSLPTSSETETTTSSDTTSLSPDLTRIEDNIMNKLAELRRHVNHTRGRLGFLQHSTENSNDEQNVATNQEHDYTIQKNVTAMGPCSSRDHVVISSGEESPEFSYRRSFDVSPSLSLVSCRTNGSEIVTEPEFVGSQLHEQSPKAPLLSSSDRTIASSASMQFSPYKQFSLKAEDVEEDDGIEILAELLPRSLRQPEVLELGSSSDSDISIKSPSPNERDKPCCSKSLDTGLTEKYSRRKRRYNKDPSCLDKPAIKSIVVPSTNYLLAVNTKEGYRMSRRHNTESENEALREPNKYLRHHHRRGRPKDHSPHSENLDCGSKRHSHGHRKRSTKSPSDDRYERKLKRRKRLANNGYETSSD